MLLCPEREKRGDLGSPPARLGSQVNAKPLGGDLLGRSPLHQASTMRGEPKKYTASESFCSKLQPRGLIAVAARVVC